MREVTHTTTLPFDVHTVFGWFKNLDENYIQWHPVAHQKFEWLTQKPVGEGTLFYFVENIKGHQHKITMKITEYKEDVKLSFTLVKIQAHTKYLPAWFLTILSSLFRIKLYITHQFDSRTPESVTVLTRQTMGSQLPVFGVLVDWGIESFILHTLDQQSHVAEEWEYMERELASRRK